MTTLRNYISADQVKQYCPDIDETMITDSVLQQAESVIDAYVSEFYEGPFAKAFGGYQVYNATAVNGTNITVNGALFTNEIFRFCAVEIVSGAAAGQRAAIGSNTQNTLSLTTQIDGLVAPFAFKVWQYGKFPMKQDMASGYKFMPEALLEALSYQIEFILTNPSKSKGRGKKSESIGQSYSYQAEDIEKDSIKFRISPLAKDIIDAQGWSMQTI